MLLRKLIVVKVFSNSIVELVYLILFEFLKYSALNPTFMLYFYNNSV
jgi:hypothetical protein